MVAHDGCEGYREQLTDLLDGELPDTEAGQVQTHIGQCPACTREVALLTGLMGGLRSIPEDEPPPALLARVMERVRQETWLERLARLLGSLVPTGIGRALVPALALGALLAVVVLGPSLRPRPADGLSGVAQAPGIRSFWFGGTIHKNGMDLAPTASGRSIIEPGDDVQTTGNARLHMTYPDGTRVEVAGGSHIIIKSQGLFLSGGHVTVRTGRPSVGAYQVQTQNATIVDIGTTFKVHHKDLVTTVEVAEGGVRIASRGGAQDVWAGSRATVDARGATAVQTPPRPDTGHRPRSRPEDVRAIDAPRPR